MQPLKMLGLKAALWSACQVAQHVGLAVNMLCLMAVVALDWIPTWPAVEAACACFAVVVSRCAAWQRWIPLGTFGHCSLWEMWPARHGTRCYVASEHGHRQLQVPGGLSLSPANGRPSGICIARTESASVGNAHVPQATRACLYPAGTARVR